MVDLHSLIPLSQPGDAKASEFGWFSSYPWVLGGDLAGTVVEVGAGVENFKQGDRVTPSILTILKRLG